MLRMSVTGVISEIVVGSHAVLGVDTATGARTPVHLSCCGHRAVAIGAFDLPQPALYATSHSLK